MSVEEDTVEAELEQALLGDLRDRALRERETALRLAEYLAEHHPDTDAG